MNKINLEIEILNNKLTKLFERLSKYSDDKLNNRIKKNKWSINQNIYHFDSWMQKAPNFDGSDCYSSTYLDLRRFRMNLARN